MSAKKAKKATKVAKSQPDKGVRGIRYDAEKKKEVVEFVNEYNAKNGRGGQSAAARKFGLSILTVAAWLKKGSYGAVRSKSGTNVNLAKNVNALLDLVDEIRKAESELDRLRAKYDTIRASVQSSL